MVKLLLCYSYGNSLTSFSHKVHSVCCVWWIISFCCYFVDVLEWKCLFVVMISLCKAKFKNSFVDMQLFSYLLDFIYMYSIWRGYKLRSLWVFCYRPVDLQTLYVLCNLVAFVEFFYSWNKYIFCVGKILEFTFLVSYQSV